ncbi:carbonic anhydrase [Kribbella sp. NPDC003557]|uniref:carbonic anhydrase n=1 Tax=Kribbella sp. NPDC003557 TaxID=3154449 RepID=UPI0033B4B764
MNVLSRRHVLTVAGAILGAALGAAALAGCADATGDQSGAASPDAGTQPPTGALVADGKQALARLKAGNARFVAAQDQKLDEGIARRIAVSKGQQPFATVLGCVDSRVPIELVFDQGLGDLVVVRSAGGALDHSVIGSLEFGVAELHTPLLLVLGHQRCGAVTAAMNAVDSAHRTSDYGDIDYVIGALTPAVHQARGKPGDRLTNAIRTNVDLTLAKLRRSPVIAPLEKAGRLTLAGAYYELDTGKVILS